jgi:hypothetical protein
LGFNLVPATQIFGLFLKNLLVIPILCFRLELWKRENVLWWLIGVRVAFRSFGSQLQTKSQPMIATYVRTAIRCIGQKQETAQAQSNNISKAKEIAGQNLKS